MIEHTPQSKSIHSYKFTVPLSTQKAPSENGPSFLNSTTDVDPDYAPPLLIISQMKGSTAA